MIMDKELVADAGIAEYNSLRQELQLRIVGQRQVNTWLLTITGAVLTIFLTLKPHGTNPLLVEFLGSPPCTLVYSLSAMTLSVFVLAVQTLVIFWLYQLYMVFQISGYIMILDGQLYSGGDRPIQKKLFGWESHMAGGIGDKSLSNASRQETTGLFGTIIDKLTKLGIWTISIMQPAPILAIGSLGLYFLWYVRNELSAIVQVEPVWLVVASLALTTVWIVLLLLFVALHRVQRQAADLALGAAAESLETELDGKQNGQKKVDEA